MVMRTEDQLLTSLGIDAKKPVEAKVELKTEAPKAEKKQPAKAAKKEEPVAKPSSAKAKPEESSAKPT